MKEVLSNKPNNSVLFRLSFWATQNPINFKIILEGCLRLCHMFIPMTVVFALIFGLLKTGFTLAGMGMSQRGRGRLTRTPIVWDAPVAAGQPPAQVPRGTSRGGTARRARGPHFMNRGGARPGP